MTLEELAERCEATTRADRELDAVIRCAVFAGPKAYVKQSPYNGEWCVYETGYSGKERAWEPPRDITQEQRIGSFTASLDAAMQLVPEGHHWQVGIGIETEFGHRDRSYAWCSAADCGELSIAATPALALCAAALKAQPLAGTGAIQVTPLTNNPASSSPDRPGIPTIPPAGAEVYRARQFANVLASIREIETPNMRWLRENSQAIRAAAAEMDAENGL